VDTIDLYKKLKEQQDNLLKRKSQVEQELAGAKQATNTAFPVSGVALYRFRKERRRLNE
jgi:hypothetical protein